MLKNVLIACATTTEHAAVISAFRKQCISCQVECSCFTGDTLIFILNGYQCFVSCVGVGKVAAATTVASLCQEYDFKLIISYGLAGALVSGLSRGDVILSTRVCQHDMDLTPLGTPRMLTLDEQDVYLHSVPDYSNEFATLWDSFTWVDDSVSLVATGDQFLTKTAKKEVASLTGALCCDMEGYAVAHVAKEKFVPFLLMKVISDTFEGNADDEYNKSLEDVVQEGALLLVHSLQLLKLKK